METDRAKRRALSYSIRKGVRWESSLSDFQHQSLETLVIFGFQFDDYMVRYIRRVMETAVNLEDVFLYDRLACIKCRDDPPPSNFPSTESEKLAFSRGENHQGSRLICRSSVPKRQGNKGFSSLKKELPVVSSVLVCVVICNLLCAKADGILRAN
jgi:hypothetical protein